MDDAYALTLLASLREAKVLGVTTVSGPTEQRAQLAAKLLMTLGGSEIPVYAGRRSDQPMNRQIEWARGFRSSILKKVSVVEFLHKQIQRAPGEITLIAIGPLTNLGDLFYALSGDSTTDQAYCHYGWRNICGLRQQTARRSRT